MKRAVVCFDLGGTLVDLRKMVDCIASSIQARFPRSAADAADLAFRWAVKTAEALPQAQGPYFRPERIIAARVFREVLSSVELEVSDEEALRTVLAAWSAFVEGASLCQDVTDAWWDQMHASAQRIALVTDIDEEAAAGLLDRLRLRPHFDAVILSETERAYKPDPALYRRAVEAVGAESKRCLFVSDSPVDLIGAKEEGMPTALIQRSLRVSSLAPPSDSLLLKTLNELPAILVSYEQTGRYRP